jgi:hypothetical protein
MHASIVRAMSRLAAIAVAIAVACALTWSPAQADTGQADTYGPGYAIPDSEGNADTSHIGAYGPPGLTVHGQLETYCADPERKGPDTAGGYADPVTVSHWTSSVTGDPVPDTHLAYASYVIGRYGQTRDAAQAAAVDAVVYEWLAGGTYSIDGTRGAQRLAYPNVSPTATTLARGYLAEAKTYAGPYPVTLTPDVDQTAAGRNVSVSVKVTANWSGAPVPGVRVELSESGSGTASAVVTTTAQGTATWEFTAKSKGTATVEAKAQDLPASQLRVLNPTNGAAQRMLLAGTPTTAQGTATVTVTPATGGVTIHKKDPDGTPVTGAAFRLLDPASGTTVASGKTGTDGTLAFDGLAPGTYRLHETDTGSRLHDLVPDQDITITEGKNAAANPITIIDPFKHGTLLVKKVDKTTGQPLPGAVITITVDTVDAAGKHTPGRKIARLTTGEDGTATLTLPVTRAGGTAYWASETKAPPGYAADAAAQRFTVTPAARTTITLADTRTPATAPPAARPQASAQLAHTGAADTRWLIGASGVLLASGGGVVWAAARRRSRTNTPTDS